MRIYAADRKTKDTEGNSGKHSPIFFFFRNTISMLLFWCSHAAHVWPACGDPPRADVLTKLRSERNASSRWATRPVCSPRFRFLSLAENRI